MARTIQVEIVSAEAAIFSGDVTFLVAPAVMGDVGITPGHTALLTRLKPGEIRVVQPEGEDLLIYVSGGVLEVQPSVVTVLADVALRAEDIDEQAAQEAKRLAEQHKERAEKAMRDGMPVFDYAKAKAELAEAAAQLQTLKDLRKRTGGKQGRRSGYT